jgi:subtilisin family serine protease
MSKGKKTPNAKRPREEKLDEYTRVRPLPPEKIFTRGLIEVEFVKTAQSGVESWDFEREQDRQEFADVWPPQLKEKLAKHNLLSWRPSFPLRYPWTHGSDEQVRASYIKAGRDKFVTFQFPLDADLLSIAKELKELPELKQAVAIPNIAPPSGPLTEPLTGTSDQVVSIASSSLTNQWYLFRCRVPEAWEQATGRGVVIADIDWGFNVNHQDLQPRIRRTRNTLKLPNRHTVNNGNRLQHGNAVLGLAGAAVNDLGMTGIAFEADLWAFQAGTDSLTDHDLWVAAINEVHSTASIGRKIIILEVQTEGGSNIEMIPSINQEIILAIADGIVVCVPAGNGNASGDAGIGDDGCDIPPTDSILVGATRFDTEIDQLSFSNKGDRVVVYAPGDLDHDLTCGMQRDCYLENFGGTSGATAKVAGVVALMLEMNYQLSPHAIRDILMRSQKPVCDQGTSLVPIGVLLDAKQAVDDAIAGI